MWKLTPPKSTPFKNITGIKQKQMIGKRERLNVGGVEKFHSDEGGYRLQKKKKNSSKKLGKSGLLTNSKKGGEARVGSGVRLTGKLKTGRALHVLFTRQEIRNLR